MRNTVRERVTFTVKEGHEGVVWIALENSSAIAGFGALPDGLFGFDLPPGTTIDGAREVAAYLNANINALAFTPRR